jgi:hypothetical protein
MLWADVEASIVVVVSEIPGCARDDRTPAASAGDTARRDHPLERLPQRLVT